MKFDLVIDGMLSGTGVRDAVDGGYVGLAETGLSSLLVRDIARWQQEYEEAHFAGFPDDIVAALDKQGIDLAVRAEDELPSKSIGYYSNGRMKLLT